MEFESANKRLYKLMSQCPNCQQYHNSSSFLHSNTTCFTYQKFTTNLQGEFNQRNKAEYKRSKLINHSSPHAPNIGLISNTANKRYAYIEKEDKDSEKTVKKVYRSNSNRSKFDKEVDRRIQNLISKSRRINNGSKQHSHQNSKQLTKLNSIKHLHNTTDSEEFIDTKKQSIIMDDDMTDRQSLFFEDNISVPSQTPFRKPFTAADLKANPKIYDTFSDYRCCGISLSQPGEMILSPHTRVQLLTKMKKQ